MLTLPLQFCLLPEEEQQNEEGSTESINTIELEEGRKNRPQLEPKDPAATKKLGSNGIDEEKEVGWIDAEEPLDLINTSEESFYESLIKEMPRCLLNYDFRIRKGDPRNLKIPCMIANNKFIANAYINVNLPINIMSFTYYNSIQKDGYVYRGRNFTGLERDMHVFIGNMSYVMDFAILENIETNINPSLSHVVFRRPFVEIVCLAINRKHGLITFTEGIREVTFKTPYKDPERNELTSEGYDILSSRKLFSNMKIRFSGVHVPLFDTMLFHDQPGQGEGPTVSVESQHTPTASSPSKSQPTTSQPRSSQETSSQAPSSHEPTTEQQIPQTTSSMPHDSPLSGGSTPGSVEGSMQLKELTNLCTKLLARVTSLETEIKKTQEVHGKALTKLVKKVKTFGRSAQVYNKEEKCNNETEHAEEVEYGDILEHITKQITLSKGPQGEEQSQESSEVHLDQEKVQENIGKSSGSETSQWHIKALKICFKAFDREDLDTLWSLVKERFKSVAPTEDMERALWVKLKRIYEPDKEDTLWKLQRNMHDSLTWRLYGSCAVHHVFSTRGHCIYMLPEKDYPLTTTLMMLQVEEDSEMARDLVKKIFIEVNRSRS
ncbi:hypothetical protein Tco_0733099 [Tanacetum coccineum]